MPRPANRQTNHPLKRLRPLAVAGPKSGFVSHLFATTCPRRRFHTFLTGFGLGAHRKPSLSNGLRGKVRPDWFCDRLSNTPDRRDRLSNTPAIRLTDSKLYSRDTYTIGVICLQFKAFTPIPAMLSGKAQQQQQHEVGTSQVNITNIVRILYSGLAFWLLICVPTRIGC